MLFRTALLIAAAVGWAATAQAQNRFGDQPQAPPYPQGQQAYPQQGYPQGNPQQPGYPQQGSPQGNPQQQGYPQQSYPQQPAYPQSGAYPAQPGSPQEPGYPAQGNPMPPSMGGGAPDQLSQMERQDFGVPPTQELHAGPMHGPTPASIPGGQVITTKGLTELMQGRQVPFLVLDVLGAPEMIPGAVSAVPAHQPGTFNDPTQREFGGFLQQRTNGNKEIPLVFYCQSNQCWMSYNAALRAINMGYTNVLWYRGGLEAWKAAGQHIQTAYQGYPPPQGTGR